MCSYRGTLAGKNSRAESQCLDQSHAQLNESTELDEGDPVQLGRQHHELLSKLKQLNVFGGCCGTDHRHVEEICKACITR